VLYKNGPSCYNAHWFADNRPKFGPVVSFLDYLASFSQVFFITPNCHVSPWPVITAQGFLFFSPPRWGQAAKTGRNFSGRA